MLKSLKTKHVKIKGEEESCLSKIVLSDHDLFLKTFLVPSDVIDSALET